MSPEDAERLAIPFGLTYLSREGYAKLAELLAHVIDAAQPRPAPQPVSRSLRDIVKPQSERIG